MLKQRSWSYTISIKPSLNAKKRRMSWLNKETTSLKGTRSASCLEELSCKSLKTIHILGGQGLED